MTTSSPDRQRAAQLTQAAVAAYQAGQQQLAHSYLVEATAADAGYELAWLWRTQVAANPQEQRDCLKQILRLNPQHRQARLLLERLGPEQRTSLAPAPAVLTAPHERVAGGQTHIPGASVDLAQRGAPRPDEELPGEAEPGLAQPSLASEVQHFGAAASLTGVLRAPGPMVAPPEGAPASAAHAPAASHVYTSAAPLAARAADLGDAPAEHGPVEAGAQLAQAHAGDLTAGDELSLALAPQADAPPMREPDAGRMDEEAGAALASAEPSTLLEQQRGAPSGMEGLAGEPAQATAHAGARLAGARAPAASGATHAGRLPLGLILGVLVLGLVMGVSAYLLLAPGEMLRASDPPPLGWQRHGVDQVSVWLPAGYAGGSREQFHQAMLERGFATGDAAQVAREVPETALLALANFRGEPPQVYFQTLLYVQREQAGGQPLASYVDEGVSRLSARGASLVSREARPLGAGTQVEAQRLIFETAEEGFVRTTLLYVFKLDGYHWALTFYTFDDVAASASGYDQIVRSLSINAPDPWS